MNKTVCLILTGLISSPGFTQDAERPPEFKALDQFVGTWAIEVSVTYTDRPEKEKISIRRKCEWILGKRYLRAKDVITNSRNGEKSEVMQLLTYDVKRKSIRRWLFPETGPMTESTGAWDEKTNSFNLKTEYGGGFLLAHEGAMKNDDTYIFTNVLRDSEEKVLLKAEGQMKRIKTIEF